MSTARGERGMTLTEVTIVFVLASLVMTGLITFYFNSQAVWVDSSAQAITQREATMVIEAIAARARRARYATVNTITGDIDLVLPGNNPDSVYSFWLDGSRRLHQGYRTLGVDRGPMLISDVECFSSHKDTLMLYIDSLRVRSASGSQVTISTAAAFQNR